MKNILILDDDKELCELLAGYLKQEGFSVTSFHHPTKMFEKFTASAFDLLILDVMLPGMNGFDVLKEVRDKSSMPVIMLTARGDEVDRIVGLELGADDYLPKPFNPRELAARIRAIFRRATHLPSQIGTIDQILVGDIKILPGSHQVFCRGAEINLTNVEYRLLCTLANSGGKVIDRQELAKEALDRHLEYDDRSLDVHMSNLRKKIGNITEKGERIQTIRGIGYLFAIFSETAGE